MQAKEIRKILLLLLYFVNYMLEEIERANKNSYVSSYPMLEPMNKSAKKRYWGICFAIFLSDFILELYYLLFLHYALQTSSLLYSTHRVVSPLHFTTLSL